MLVEYGAHNIAALRASGWGGQCSMPFGCRNTLQGRLPGCPQNSRPLTNGIATLVRVVFFKKGPLDLVEHAPRRIWLLAGVQPAKGIAAG
ncbi:hypothetical protein [Nitratidesulfovibrio sp.]|uniref:hypothetical protein n=1 Tax=Nitratidesulfovibrio sp. TaxID=2802297 RepID=UPI0033420216